MQERLSKMEFGWSNTSHEKSIEFSSPISQRTQDLLLYIVRDALNIPRDENFEVTALSATTTIAGLYKFVRAQGENYFVRVTSRIADALFEKTVTDYLKTKDVAISAPIVSGWIFEHAGSHWRLDVRLLIDGRHFNGSESDLNNSATLLSDFHQAMKNFPQKHEIYQRQRAFSNKIDKIMESLQWHLSHENYSIFYEKSEWARNNKSWIETMIMEFNPHFEKDEEAQCLHEQVHPFNIIFEKNTGEAILIDFETSIRTYGPIGRDLAYYVQRFCLKDEPTLKAFEKRLILIEDAYGHIPVLTQMMRRVAWYSMVCAFNFRMNQNVVLPESEYNKFIALEKQAQKYEEILG